MGSRFDIYFLFLLKREDENDIIIHINEVILCIHMNYFGESVYMVYSLQ
jgi:hypothetical protein